ncbi:hypothetical protein LPU83_pLPU83c_0306 (plasmid) [Rhizobium favelukesii]|uniref:Uncharacterized protein n=1 Tax=Rhizobium favelukesii TaxID=348824 RepID=W6RPU2_9HYPH|nr:hypothetical protein LPU83_pLPU83c_0306 [Rhizobium favelukesii]
MTACTSAQGSVSTKESNLAAGFVARPADTPKRQAMRNHLPPDTFVTSTRGNKTTYVYADPGGCKCLYVGTQQAYRQYRTLQQANAASQRQLAAQVHPDSGWDWGNGCPWISDFNNGPFGQILTPPEQSEPLDAVTRSIAFRAASVRRATVNARSREARR